MMNLTLARASTAFLFVSSLLAGRALAEGPPYTVSAVVPAAKVGAAASAHIEIKPAAGYHVNKDFPTSLKLVAPAGVDLPKAKLAKGDAGVKVEEKEAGFDVPFTVKEAGKKTITGQLSFAVCTETSCVPQKTQVSINVEAK